MTPGNGPLQLQQVWLSLRDTPVLSPTDLTIQPGEVVTIMGKSGIGKSSLLAWMCGTLAPSFRAGGTLYINGRELTHLPPEQRRLGILFQDDLLFPHMSVGENLLFAIPRTVHAKKERLEQMHQALEEAGLAGFDQRSPATLSGGQRARVAVMRTLLSAPQALLLDEPFSRLDADTRDSFRTFVFDHAAKGGLPTLTVTHDPDDALAGGGRIFRMQPAAQPSSLRPGTQGSDPLRVDLAPVSPAQLLGDPARRYTSQTVE